MILKQIFLLLFLCCALPLAQNEIPNPSFEMWSSEDPDFWATFNSYGNSPNVTPSTDAYSGSLSARMEKVPGNFAAPGMQAHDGNGNAFLVSQNYEFLVGYYKFFPLEDDSIRISVVLQGGEFSETEEFPLKMGTLKLGETAEEWTRFEVPIIEQSPGDVDRGSVIFQLENTSGLHDGTYFLVDSLELLMELKPDDDPSIGVIREFNNVRPAFIKFKGVAAGDWNGDGISEIAVMQGCTLKLYDPVTKELHLAGDFDQDGDVDGSDFLICDNGELAEGVSVNLIGFVNFGGIQYAVVNAAAVDGADFLVWQRGIIINTVSNEIVYSDEGLIVGIFILPNGDLVILAYIEQDNLFKIIGEIGSTSNNLSSHKVISYTNQGDYQLDLKFQADPGLQLAYDPDLFDPAYDTDINADGYLDIQMLKMESGEPSGMIVHGGDNLDILWDFTFPDEYKENILKGFHGFADVNGDGEKEAIFGDNLVVTLDGTVHTIAENFIMLDVNDIDSDGFEDIIGINTVDSSIVVYGFKTSTSAANNNEAEIHFQLFQNYPNPFNPNTTISYSVSQPGEVDLTIFNSLGQVVRRLVSETKPAGEYTLTWDGRNDVGKQVSSGAYFYRLRVDELIQTRRMLLLK
jgi:hypothetical protein